MWERPAPGDLAMGHHAHRGQQDARIGGRTATVGPTCHGVADHSLVPLSSSPCQAGKKVLDAGTAGLALSYALQLTGLLNMTVRLGTLAEMAFNAVERVDAYSKEEPEGPSEWRPGM